VRSPAGGHLALPAAEGRVLASCQLRGLNHTRCPRGAQFFELLRCALCPLRSAHRPGVAGAQQHGGAGDLGWRGELAIPVPPPPPPRIFIIDSPYKTKITLSPVGRGLGESGRR
jgi:hypothetical protein